MFVSLFSYSEKFYWFKKIEIQIRHQKVMLSNDRLLLIIEEKIKFYIKCKHGKASTSKGGNVLKILTWKIDGYLKVGNFVVI